MPPPLERAPTDAQQRLLPTDAVNDSITAPTSPQPVSQSPPRHPPKFEKIRESIYLCNKGKVKKIILLFSASEIQVFFLIFQFRRQFEDSVFL